MKEKNNSSFTKGLLMFLGISLTLAVIFLIVTHFFIVLVS